jgi:hypothetical protein
LPIILKTSKIPFGSRIAKQLPLLIQIEDYKAKLDRITIPISKLAELYFNLDESKHRGGVLAQSVGATPY